VGLSCLGGGLSAWLVVHVTISSRQVDAVEKRVEFAAVTNSVTADNSINFNQAIRLAFVLGTRFGIASPYVAGNFLGAWAQENAKVTDDIPEFALRYELAMRACIWPLTMTDDDFSKTEGQQE